MARNEDLDADDVLGDLVRRGREMSAEEFAEFCEELAHLLEQQAAASRSAYDHEGSEDDE